MEAAVRLAEIEAAEFIRGWQLPMFNRYDLAFRHLGYPMDSIYSELKLDTSLFSSLMSGVDARAVLSIFRKIEAKTGDSCLGAKLGLLRQPKTLGSRFYIALFSQNLREALEDFFFESALRMPFLKMKLVESSNQMSAEFEFTFDDPAISYEVDIDILTLVSLIREVLHYQDWKPARVLVKHRLEPERRQLMESKLGCSIESDSECNAVVISEEYTRNTLPWFDLSAKKIMLNAHRSELAQMFGDYGAAMRTKYFFARYFEYKGSVPSVEEAADYFSWSLSTYNRELRREGAHFRALRNEFIYRVAEGLLELNYPAEKVANIFAYRHKAVFTRFIKGHEQTFSQEK